MRLSLARAHKPPIRTCCDARVQIIYFGRIQTASKRVLDGRLHQKDGRVWKKLLVALSVFGDVLELGAHEGAEDNQRW